MFLPLPPPGLVFMSAKQVPLSLPCPAALAKAPKSKKFAQYSKIATMECPTKHHNYEDIKSKKYIKHVASRI